MSVVVDLGQVQGGSTNEDGPAPLCLQISSDGWVQPLADAVSPGVDVLPCSVEAIPAEPVSIRDKEEAECVTAATVDAEWGNEDDCDEVNEALTCLQIFTSADLALEIDEKTALASHAPNESDAHSSMPPAAQSEQAVCQLQQAPDPESKLHDTSLTLEQQIEEFEKQIATMEGLPASNDSVHSTYAELHSPAPHELVHKMRLAMKDIPEEVAGLEDCRRYLTQKQHYTLQDMLVVQYILNDGILMRQMHGDEDEYHVDIKDPLDHAEKDLI